MTTESISFDYFPCPSWAAGKANGEICVGAQLCTRDGRRVGNATVVAFPVSTHGFTVADVLTDAGNSLRLTEAEIAELFYPPQWLMHPSTAPGLLPGIITNPELESLIRLANAAAQVRAQASSGALFEGYDGAEPQRTQACAALDELEDATDAAIAALQAITARSIARQSQPA